MTDAEKIVALAEKVMGWRVSGERCPVFTLPNGVQLCAHEWTPLDHIGDAFMVAHAMHERGMWLKLTSPWDTKFTNSEWFAGFTEHGFTGWSGRPCNQAHSDNPARAICEAALLAVQS